MRWALIWGIYCGLSTKKGRYRTIEEWMYDEKLNSLLAAFANIRRGLVHHSGRKR
ncbi:hypothetical protein FHX49_000022 [Microbacterium endophyticum]|uniref:Uncharacterized protein n=1 Tax=Microbacterium endophyticum TaxID=1526412 RepID=A0A7W4V0A1_9MICO|nr:hypothetical protein [Microbacterium endophyticum]NIK36778.1 hypothetical protein [Microbacterium endophyticum]